MLATQAQAQAAAAGETAVLTSTARWSRAPVGAAAALGRDGQPCAHLHSSAADRHNSVPRRMAAMTSIPPAAREAVASKDESREFMAMFPDIVRDLTDAGRHLDIPEVTKWFSKVLQYNVPGGKKNRAMAVVYSFRMLAQKDQLTPENIHLAMVSGWCVEMVQAFFLVMDDIMDESTTRRGRQCWYKVNNIGLAAINDAILLESGVFQLLRTHIRDKPYYLDVVELFHDTIFKTAMGQSLDIQTSSKGKPDLNVFTMDHYQAIVKYKTSYYSFYLPVSIAMYMAGIRDPEIHRQARTILLEMGNFFQVQDDFLDCYGDPSVTGKIGGDIKEGKCSWLAVVALQRANPQQRKVMEECYGSSDPEKIERIKDLFDELNVPQTYRTYEEESYNLIRTHIQQVSRGLPVELFFKFLEKIYKRQN